MTTALRPAGGAVSQPGPVHSSAPATAAHPVVLRATPKQIGDLERSIPLLVSQVRRQLGSDRDGVRREIVLDLSAVPPMPVVAPLLLLVRLLGGLTGPGGKVEVIGGGHGARRRLDGIRPAGQGHVDRRAWTAVAGLKGASRSIRVRQTHGIDILQPQLGRRGLVCERPWQAPSGLLVGGSRRKMRPRCRSPRGSR